MPDPDDQHPAIPDLVSLTPDPGDHAFGGAPGAGGGFDLGAIFEQAAQMQQHLAEAQEQAAATVVEGVSGGGVVRITVTGAGEFESVTISPDVVDPTDVDMLQDLVLAALRDAAAKVTELQQGAMGGFDLGGLDLGGLLGGD